jgi:hypothetical protein
MQETQRSCPSITRVASRALHHSRASNRFGNQIKQMSAFEKLHPACKSPGRRHVTSTSVRTMEQTKALEANASNQPGITMNDLENSAGCQHLIEQTMPDGGRRATFVLGQLVGLRSNALMTEQKQSRPQLRSRSRVHFQKRPIITRYTLPLLRYIFAISPHAIRLSFPPRTVSCAPLVPNLSRHLQATRRLLPSPFTSRHAFLPSNPSQSLSTPRHFSAFLLD